MSATQRGRFSGRSTGGNPGFPAGVRNGRVPQSLLYHLETQASTAQFPESEHWLAPTAGRNFDAMVRAAKSDGVTIQLLEAYRTLAKQEYFWDLYCNHGGNLAAKPGTSNHGWGTAFDLDQHHDSHALPWLHAHAAEYGWDLPDALGKKEPWHWQAIRGAAVVSSEVPVYVHGKLIPGAYMGNPTGEGVLVFLRPVAEALGFTLAVQGRDATLTKGDQRAEIHFLATADGRGFVPVRELCDKLSVPLVWDGAVRIG